MSIDAFYHRKYDAKTYNCAHFVCEVWRSITGNDIAHKLAGFMLPPSERFVRVSLRHEFKRLTAPLSPCIVLMQQRRQAPHVGLYLRGRVFHITDKGVQFQPIEVATVGFKTIGFYNV